MNLCGAFGFMDTNPDVFLGWTAWAAGSFDATYPLALTPTRMGSNWTDVPLMTACVAGKFGAASKRAFRSRIIRR